MKCLIVQPIHEDGLAMLRGAGIEPVLCPVPDMATVASLIPGCIAVITRDAGLSAATIAASDNLRVIVVHGTGHDAVDKDAATRKGILVCNTPGANARSVSEMALGLAFAAARLIPAADHAERTGAYGFREREETLELSGKTALIVGWGSIGSYLGRMLNLALEMRVMVYSPRASDIGGFERASSLAEGLAQADLVSLHTPLRAETHGLIGDEALSRMKRGAILINTARAGLIDEDALARSLLSGQIAAAALDVYSHGAPSGPLAQSSRVIFTPHLGGSTVEAMRRVALGSVRNVLQALSGERPATALNEPDKEHRVASD